MGLETGRYFFWSREQLHSTKNVRAQRMARADWAQAFLLLLMIGQVAYITQECSEVVPAVAADGDTQALDFAGGYSCLDFERSPFLGISAVVIFTTFVLYYTAHVLGPLRLRCYQLYYFMSNSAFYSFVCRAISVSSKLVLPHNEPCQVFLADGAPPDDHVHI